MRPGEVREGRWLTTPPLLASLVPLVGGLLAVAGALGAGALHVLRAAGLDHVLLDVLAALAEARDPTHEAVHARSLPGGGSVETRSGSATRSRCRRAAAPARSGHGNHGSRSRRPRGRPH